MLPPFECCRFNSILHESFNMGLLFTQYRMARLILQSIVQIPTHIFTNMPSYLLSSETETSSSTKPPLSLRYGLCPECANQTTSLWGASDTLRYSTTKNVAPARQGHGEPLPSAYHRGHRQERVKQGFPCSLRIGGVRKMVL